jgi:S1-C subfamily serine protease
MLGSRHAAKVESPFSSGTGFPISGTVWLTAAHVIGRFDPGQITVDGLVVLEIIELGEDLDAVLLVTEPHGHKPWPLADRAPRPGETVFKSGYGAGAHWWTAGLGTEDPDRVAMDIFPGDSGGPVFSTEGEVLGIIVTVGVHRGTIIMHHAGIVPMTLILEALPEGLLDAEEGPAPPPPAPVPVEETPWERFLRLKKEQGL